MERSRLPLPIIISLIGPWGRAMRHDVRRINYWTREEIHWMRTLGKSTLEADKFNPGQKLNAIFVGVSILVMLVTGGNVAVVPDLSRAVAIGGDLRP